MRKYNGAISLFMIIILMTCFIFGGIFIDASRILVARSKVRNAMNTALRSSMSYYDKSLVGDYGLYAYDGDTGSELFNKYFTANMQLNDENIKMFEYNIVKAESSNNLCITDEDEFKRQVVEYSKYRAPVTTTMILIDKVKDTFANFKSNSDKIKGATDSLDEFKEQYQKDANQIKTGLSSIKTTVADNLKDIVNTNIDMVKDDINYIKTLKDNVAEQFDLITGENGEINESKNTMDKMEADTETYRKEASKDLIDINNGAEGISGESSGDDDVESYPTADYNQSEDDIAKQADNQTGEKGSLRTAVDNLKSNVDTIKGEINGLIAQLEPTASSLIGAKALLATYQDDVNKKKGILEEAERVYNNTFTAWTEYEKAEDSYNDNDKKAKECQTKINEALIEISGNSDLRKAVDMYNNPASSPDYDKNNPQTSSKKIKDNLKKQYSDLKNIFNLMDDYQSYVKKRDDARTTMNKSNATSLKKAFDDAVTNKNAAKSAYDAAVGVRDNQQGVVNTLNDEVDDLKGQIQDKLKELKNLAVPEPSELNIVDLAKEKIMGEIDKIDIVSALKELYEQLSKEMQHYSVSSETTQDVGSKLANGLLKKVKSLCDYAKDLFETFTSLENLRNQAYMVDYIMDKCTYLTSQTTRNHWFEKGEVEYIIFGHKSQIANITACITTLTLMRFVINFIDYFIKGPGDLVAKAIYGLGRGAAKTYLDMTRMLLTSPTTNPKENIRDGIGLCPSFDSLKLTYSDHLRLLLFFKFSRAQKGLKDTIYTNMNETLEGGDLNKLYTRMKANVEVEVNLLLVPIFAEAFTSKYFRDGKFVITDNSTLGY